MFCPASPSVVVRGTSRRRIGNLVRLLGKSLSFPRTRRMTSLNSPSSSGIYSQLLAHPICPIGTSDGESNNTSHPAQGFCCCHRLAGLIATPNDGRMLLPALNAFPDSSHHWPLDDLVLRPAGLKRFHGLCHCCSDFALGRGFECPH